MPVKIITRQKIMSKRVATIIPNFNMPERAEAIARYIEQNCAEQPEIIVVDNGSDVKYGKYGHLLLSDNVQTTGAWLMGMHYADALQQKYKGSFDAYWLMITSMEFVSMEYMGKDPLAPMYSAMFADDDVVGVHASLTQDSTTSWDHLKVAEHHEPELGNPWYLRPTWMIDNICALWRADWFNAIGRFDPRLIYAWGVDLETCMLARAAKKKLLVCDAVQVKKVTDIGYTMGRMGMEADERKKLARENMDQVFTSKYGPDWRKVMYVE